MDKSPWAHLWEASSQVGSELHLSSWISGRWSWYTKPGRQGGEEAGWWHRSITAAFLDHSIITARLRLQVACPTQLPKEPTSQLQQVARGRVQANQRGAQGWRSPTTLVLVLSPRCHLPRQRCLCPRTSQCKPQPKPWARTSRQIHGPCVSLWSLFKWPNFPCHSLFFTSRVCKYLFQSTQ